MRKFATQYRFGAAWAIAALATVYAGSAQALVSSACDLAVKGDVDNDGKTIVTDVQCLILTNLWALSGALTLEPTCLHSETYQPGQQYILGADINCNGDNNVADVQLEIQLALQLPFALAIDADGDHCVDICKLDFDSDGTPDVGDCAPYDPRIRPGAPEVCDGINNTCGTGASFGPDAGDAAFLGCDDENYCDGVEVCPAMPSGSNLVITELMLDPSGTNNTQAQYIEIYNPTPNDIDLRTWKLAGTAAELFAIAGPRPIVIRSGGFAVFVSSPDFATNGGISGSRSFPVIPYTGILHVTNGTDQISLIDPSNALVDTVAWDSNNAGWSALFAGMEGKSIRLSPAIISQATGATTIKTANDLAANWAQSSGRWRQDTLSNPGDAGSQIIPQSDFGSPGGLWVKGEEFTPYDGGGVLQISQLQNALRCLDTVAEGIEGPACASKTAYTDFGGAACVATGCYNIGEAHPNAGFYNVDATIAATTEFFDDTDGCLIFVNETYENPANEAGGCGDGRTCSTQVCVLQEDNPTGGFQAADGCYYKAAGTACNAGAGDQCQDNFCVIVPTYGDAAAVAADALGTGLFTLVGTTTDGDSIAADGCYADNRYEAACDDGNLCTQNEACGAAGACDNFNQAGAITHAAANATCEANEAAANGGQALGCVDSSCISATGLCATLAQGIAADTCVVDADPGQAGLECVSSSAGGGYAASPVANQGCLICDPGSDPFSYSWYPNTVTDQCFIDSVCYAHGTIKALGDANLTGCEACQRHTAAVTDDDGWSPRNSGSSCYDGLECGHTDQCDGSGNCAATLQFVDTTCSSDPNADCGDSVCVEDTDTSTQNSAECSWTGKTTGGTGCFLVSGTSALGATEGTCTANGTQDPDNWCQVCDDTQTSQAYSVRDLSSAVYCDADAIANQVTLAGDGSTLTGDSNPCTVHACSANGLAGACTASGATAWEDHDFGAGETCADISCAADTCDLNGGTPRCRYQHPGAGGSSECVAAGTYSCGADTCFGTPFSAPSCLADDATPAGEETLCRSCDVTKSLIGYSDRDPLSACFGGSHCQLYSCGGEAGNEGASGTCVDRADWETDNCDALANAGCNGSNPPDNIGCIEDYAALSTSLSTGLPAGHQYFLNENQAELTSGTLPAEAAFEQACILDLNPCGNTCLIGGNTFDRGDLNPANQCEWCNPDEDISSFTPRVDTAAGYAETLTAAQGIVATAGQTAAWTFGIGAGQQVMGDFCRDSFSADANASSVDGDVCTIQRCIDNAGAGQCDTAVAWLALEHDYITLWDHADPGNTAAANDNADANCIERVGNTTAGVLVSSCVQRTCVPAGGAPTCVLEANGGDDMAGGNGECFIGGRCHDAGDGNPFGPDGQYNSGGDGHLTAQCAVCDPDLNDAPTWTAWNTADVEGWRCNADNNGCTPDSCQAGECKPNASLLPDPAVAVLEDTVDDGISCTTDYCADGSIFAIANQGNNDPGNDGTLGDAAKFDLAAVAALVITGHTWTDIHTIDAGRCLIDVNGTPTCFADGQNASSIVATTAFGNTGIANNAFCAICDPDGVTNTQVSNVSTGPIASTQTDWSPNDPAEDPTAFCNDGISCTIADACSASVVGGCKGDQFNNIPAGAYGIGQSPICNDNNPCTIDRCDEDPTDAEVFPAELTSGSDGWTAVSPFSGCRFFAAPTVVTCTDSDFCTTSDTCTDPTNAVIVASNTTGLVGTAAGQCETGNPVVCANTTECTFNYCNPTNGACTPVNIPTYYTGEFDAGTPGGDNGPTLTKPLKLGLTLAQAFDPDTNYITGTPGATTRRCDLSDWCTAGVCNATGACVVTPTGTGAQPASNDKCLTFTDGDNNSCTAPKCDPDAGTWSGTDLATFTAAPNADSIPPAGTPATLQQQGCYLATLGSGDPCNPAELFTDNSNTFGVCASTTTSVCNASGQCQFQQVDCGADNAEFNASCRDFACFKNGGSSITSQCIYKLKTGTPTCEDNNDCTAQVCAENTGVNLDDPARVYCNSTPTSTAQAPGANAVSACASIGKCHPSLGWNPDEVRLARINAHPTLGQGLGGLNWGFGQLDSHRQFTAAERTALDAAEGSSGNFDLNDNGTVDGFGDVKFCNEFPSDDPCTGPDWCRTDGTCNSTPIPECAALNTNTLCVISGPAGSTFKCPIRVVAGSVTDVSNGDVAYALQLNMVYTESEVTLASMGDVLCFSPSLCFDQPLSSTSSNIAPYSHTASFGPVSFTNWNGGGLMIISKISGAQARLNYAHFSPPFDPATTQFPAHMINTFPAGPGNPDLDTKIPEVFYMNFLLDQEILPDNPSIVYASDIYVSDANAKLLDADVWKRIIVTKPLPASSADCTGQPNTTPCEDGDLCTIGDTCVNGVCTPGSYFEDQTCEDGDQCTYEDTCVVGECTLAPVAGSDPPTPFNACDNTQNPDNDIACVVSGSEGDFFDCWLSLASASSVAATHPRAAGHDFQLAFNGPVRIARIYDKVGRAFPQLSELSGSPTINASSMWFQQTVGQAEVDALCAPGAPLQVAGACPMTAAQFAQYIIANPSFESFYGSHDLYSTPGDYVGLGWDPAANGGLGGQVAANIDLLMLDLTAISPITDAYFDAGAIAHAGGEPSPGAFLRVRFEVMEDISPTSPVIVNYGSVFPASPAGIDLNYSIDNRVVITSTEIP